MKPVKLYYDSFPGKKLCYDFVQKNEGKFLEWQTGRYQFHDILNELSIPWEWTDDPNQGMVITEIESTNPVDVPLFINEFSKRFKKLIVLSMTEPRTVQISENNYIDQYPNCFFMDVSMPSNRPTAYTHPKYFRFPFLLFRNTSSAISGFLCHGEHLMEDPIRKKHEFNHLSNNFRFEKFIMHYYLKDKYKVNNCLFSFKEASDPQVYNIVLDNIKTDKMIKPIDLAGMTKRLTEDPFETITLAGDMLFNTNERQHPRSLYQNSCMSIISESYHSEEVFFFTEKTMHPLMNAHPFITNGSQYYNKFLNSIGFELYTELFDYSFDSNQDMFSRAESIAQQVANFDRSILVDNLKATVDKVQYNKNLLTNKNSILFLKYRELMLEYIDRYYSL